MATKPKIAVAPAVKVAVPLAARINGITSDLHDLRLHGEQMDVAIGANFLEGTLTRSAGGASQLILQVHDEHRRLMRSELLAAKYEVKLDGLPFRYVGFNSPGINTPLELIHEAAVVARLRELHGPHKAYRDQMTRAEFVKARVMELHPRARFICPELHVVQPIKTERDARRAKQAAGEERDKGVGVGSNVKCKGETPSPQQLHFGEMALRIAHEEAAPFRVVVALIIALIDETDMGLVQPQNILAAEEEQVPGEGAKVRSPADEMRGFLTNNPEWTGVPGGAIGYYRRNPTAAPHTIAQAIQKSATQDGSNYAAFEDEGRVWAESFGMVGEETAGSAKGGAPIRYAFEEKKEEDHWTMMKRLAKEVNWRAFESAGWIYFMPEPDMLKAIRRMVISDSSPGVEDTAVKFDVGKEITQMTVEVRAREWAAPPGSVATVKNHGPADGDYIVEKIESPLRTRNSVMTVQMSKPSEPLPEPAPKRRTTSAGKLGSTGGGPGGVGWGEGEMGELAGTAEDVVNEVVFYAHEHGFEVTPASVTAANAVHGPTVTGAVSDHQGPPNIAWAADISNGVSTPEEAALAQAIADAFNIPWHGTRTTGELAEATHKGYRMQLIHNTFVGGDHFNHVHFGVRIVDKVLFPVA